MINQIVCFYLNIYTAHWMSRFHFILFHSVYFVGWARNHSEQNKSKQKTDKDIEAESTKRKLLSTMVTGRWATSYVFLSFVSSCLFFFFLLLYIQCVYWRESRSTTTIILCDSFHTNEVKETNNNVKFVRFNAIEIEKSVKTTIFILFHFEKCFYFRFYLFKKKK